jgi:hypothetical protein
VRSAQCGSLLWFFDVVLSNYVAQIILDDFEMDRFVPIITGCIFIIVIILSIIILLLSTVHACNIQAY